jgi:ArsR family transcriptional regulator
MGRGLQPRGSTCQLNNGLNYGWNPLPILDLARHNFAGAHELYGDRWLGLAESDLHRWLEGAGFKKIEISIVAREEQPPHFETILAGGQK